LRDAHGELLIQSTELPALEFDPGDAHFHSITYQKRRWRVFQRRDAGQHYWIQVAAPLDERDELMRKLLAPALLALLALLLLVPPTVIAGLRAGLQPLRRLTRSLSASTTPLIPAMTNDRVPIELAPFTQAIDRLVARLQASLERERRFTADAAHELRNPLAALRLELDLAGQDTNAAERALHLQRSHEALDRMQRLVTQLLMLARVENLTELDDAGPLQLGAIAEQALREASEQAGARSIALSLDREGDDVGCHDALGPAREREHDALLHLGRAETEAKVNGFEVIARRPVSYQGRTLEEFDLDAVLARRAAPSWPRVRLLAMDR